MITSDFWTNDAGIIGTSRAIEYVIEVIERFSTCDVTILILGETGTGKELFARSTHYLSDRRDRPFVPVNCGGLPENLVENELFGHRRGAYTDAKFAQRGMVALAEGGTLFLDEIDSLSLHAQTSLLRFLQDRQYRPIGSESVQTADVRVVVATNADLDSLVAQGLFRQDLRFRLDVATLKVPPLRERDLDVLLLAEHFLRRFSRQYGKQKPAINESAREALLAHPWPGNVRQLENVVHRTVILHEGGPIDAFVMEQNTLPSSAGSPCMNAVPETPDFSEGLKAAKARYVAQFERSYLSWLLEQSGGNISAAARAAGTERRHLGRMIKRAGLSVSSFRGGQGQG